jgi:hypothetical protein
MLLASLRLPARHRPPCTEMIAGLRVGPSAVDHVGLDDDRRARLRRDDVGANGGDERGEQQVSHVALGKRAPRLERVHGAALRS